MALEQALVQIAGPKAETKKPRGRALSKAQAARMAADLDDYDGRISAGRLRHP